jgi:DEAD/DEAH box helicase domain-containing protein
MSIPEFIEFLEKDRRFNRQVAALEYITPTKPRYGKLTLSDRLRDVLKKRGIELFYSHQVEAINSIKEGENVVVMTPTASGKSLIYNIPVIESIIENPEHKALYIFPLKGLEQDQVKNLNELFDAVMTPSPTPPIEGGERIRNSVEVRENRRDIVEAVDINRPSPLLGEGKGEGDKRSSAKRKMSPLHFGEVYDGDTTAYRRKKIREAIPKIIFTNPDMLHLALNPFHKKWEGLFKNLRYVVIDEIHTYRGVFGSNVAHVLRRLRRICKYWGSHPQFIAASATIANPSELAEELTGLPFKVVDQSGAPQAGRHFIFINPLDSPYTETTKLFIKCLDAGLRTIVFTKARKITELIYSWTINHVPELEGRISPYRAGFLPKERREIEQRLFNGELLGVISTSALELGVDIGGLDCCILCGYPGSVASTWQRAGRVGRHGQESMVAMIAIPDALDQYYMRHPEAFFEKSHEAAVIDPGNKNILKRHIPCASSEVYLREDDDVYDVKKLMPLIEELVTEGILNPGRRGDIWFSRRKMPHREVGIRAIGEPFDIIDESGKIVGELSGMRVFRDAFPGAIYLHRGRQYRIIELDLERKKVICGEVDVDYYTQALSKDETEVMQDKEVRDYKGLSVHWGSLKTTQKIIGYEKKRIFDRVRISRHDLDMPDYIFETEGLWITIDKTTKSFIESEGFDLAGTLHAFEHTAIACIPLFALCDRGDIGGLSYTFYPKFKQPVIFIYDGYEGGIGLTKRAFEVIGEWLMATLRIIDECPCEQGCPSCVQDPQCGSGNQPLDKEGARNLLRRWIF